ncbi:unnamed protein product [Prorocentrum cordatum]|uniref:Uncharacterized protein n=1 Tax=Prorocentrum cordatum TaxID=2364126 RepID=A0ABN9VT27_9DINO|nr:unnamed protein product [Polarella glacialis]
MVAALADGRHMEVTVTVMLRSDGTAVGRGQRDDGRSKVRGFGRGLSLFIFLSLSLSPSPSLLSRKAAAGGAAARSFSGVTAAPRPAARAPLTGVAPYSRPRIWR